MSVPLTKVDSAIAGLSIDDKAPKPSEKEVKKTHKRTPSKSGEVWNIKDLGKTPSPFLSIHPFIIAQYRSPSRGAKDRALAPNRDTKDRVVSHWPVVFT